MRAYALPYLAACVIAIAADQAMAVTCTNSGSDAGAIQSALNGGGTVFITGTCNLGSTTLTISNNTTVTGGATLNYSGGGAIFYSTGNDDTITGLTLNGGGIELGGNQFQGGWTITHNTIQNITSNQAGVHIENQLRLSPDGVVNSISNNSFHNIWAASGGYPNFPPGYDAAHCGTPDGNVCIGGSAITGWGGYDHLTIDNNTFDEIGNDAVYLAWNQMASANNDGTPNANYYVSPNGGTNDVVSNNICTKVHRYCLEIQGVSNWPSSCVGGKCSGNQHYSDGMIVKNNLSWHVENWYYNTMAFSLVYGGYNTQIINNTGLHDANGAGSCSVAGIWPGGIGIEESYSNATVQGNVIGAAPGCAYAGIIAQASSYVPGYIHYNDNFLQGDTGILAIGGDNSTYAGTVIETGDLWTRNFPYASLGSNIATLQFTGADGRTFGTDSSATWNIAVVSALSIKNVSFYIDSSATPIAFQELSDVSSTFAADRKWLYHVTLNPQNYQGTHTLHAVATDVSNATNTTSQTFTVGSGTSQAPVPTITAFSASAGSITSGQSTTLSWTQTGGTSLSIDNNIGDVTGRTSISVSPSVTTAYTLTSTNATGHVTATTTITVAAAPKPTITSFTASPTSVQNGTSSTLAWAISGATSVSIDHSIGDVSNQTSISISPTVTTIYTLTATNASGSVTATATVTVTAAPAKPSIASFTATPTSVASGSSSSLAWTVSGATSVSIDHTVGDVSNQTSASVSPTQTTTYTLTATNAAGSVTATATVTVTAAPSKPSIGSFTASPTSVTSGASSALSWTVSGATSVSIDHAVGDVSGQTSMSVSPTQTTTYTLTATNAAGSVTATATVTVTAAPTKPIITSFTAAPLSIASGASSTLSWTVSGAITLSIDQSIGSVISRTSISVSPTQTTIYTLTATNAQGITTATVTVTVAVPTIASFAAAPAAITTGQSSTLSWSQTGGTSASISPGIGDVTGQTSVSVSPTTNTTYTLTVTNAVGHVSATAAVSVTLPVPSAPTGLRAVASDGSVALNWTGSTFATSYHVKRSRVSASGYTTVATLSGTSDTDTTVNDGLTYFYVVTAIDSSGEGAASSEVSATPLNSAIVVDLSLPLPTLDVPSSLSAGDVLSASYPSTFNVTAYEWIVTPMSGTPGVPVAVQGTNSILLSDLGFTSGHYLVQAAALVDSTRLSRFTTTSTQIRSGAVAVSGSSAQVFPNPWRSDKHSGHPVTFAGLPDGSQIKIFTVSAHYVTSITIAGSKATWDPSDAASGIYLFTTKNPQGDTSKGKFVVIH